MTHILDYVWKKSKKKKLMNFICICKASSALNQLSADTVWNGSVKCAFDLGLTALFVLPKTCSVTVRRHSFYHCIMFLRHAFSAFCYFRVRIWTQPHFLHFSMYFDCNNLILITKPKYTKHHNYFKNSLSASPEAAQQIISSEPLLFISKQQESMSGSISKLYMLH